VTGARVGIGVVHSEARRSQYPEVLDGSPPEVLPALLATGATGRAVSALVEVVAAANNYLLPAWMIGFGLWLVIAGRAERLMPADT
jgi:hypothetical protein